VPGCVRAQPGLLPSREPFRKRTWIHAVKVLGGIGAGLCPPTEARHTPASPYTGLPAANSRFGRLVEPERRRAPPPLLISRHRDEPGLDFCQPIQKRRNSGGLTQPRIAKKLIACSRALLQIHLRPSARPRTGAKPTQPAEVRNAPASPYTSAWSTWLIHRIGKAIRGEAMKNLDSR